jgi:hypothetical protein
MTYEMTLTEVVKNLGPLGLSALLVFVVLNFSTLGSFFVHMLKTVKWLLMLYFDLFS